jgi:hypothetical protein
MIGRGVALCLLSLGILVCLGDVLNITFLMEGKQGLGSVCELGLALLCWVELRLLFLFILGRRGSHFYLG